jgi:hypothetical protein
MKSFPKKPPKPIAILEFLLNLSANSSLARTQEAMSQGPLRTRIEMMDQKFEKEG